MPYVLIQRQASMKYFPLFIFSSCCCKSKWCVTNNPIIYQIILYFLFINQMMYSTNILIALFWGFTSLISFCLERCIDVSTLECYILRRTNVSWNIISCQDTIPQTFPCFIFSLQRAMVVYVLFSNIYWKIGSWIYELSMDKYSSFWYTCLTEK